LNEKVDNFKPLDIKIDNNNKLLEWIVNNWIDWINKELIEINRKMVIVFSRLNKN
jgi:hypothetical protein